MTLLVERFLRRLGYRLALRRLEHPPVVARGTAVEAALAWENVGLAPPYRDDRLAFRLEDASGNEVWVSPGSTSIRGWLPGARRVHERLEIPGTIPAGRYALALAVLDPATKRPAVRLAIDGRRADGWYPLSVLELR